MQILHLTNGRKHAGIRQQWDVQYGRSPSELSACRESLLFDSHRLAYLTGVRSLSFGDKGVRGRCRCPNVDLRVPLDSCGPVDYD